MNQEEFFTDKPSLIFQNPLGWTLVNAGLISEYQLQIALIDQQRLDEIHEPHQKIGEILALRGWIKQKTADFFAVDFPELLKSSQKRKLSFYLLKAGLLEQEQVKIILNEQKKRYRSFELIAIEKGWVKSETINFFVEYLQPVEEIQMC